MYLAHISKDQTREQSVQEHLKGTAELAGGFAAVFGCEDWGYGCGLMHDIGKYSKSFQEHIRGKKLMVDHATAGAQELKQNNNIFGAYCVAGHHTGLQNGGSVSDIGSEATLCGRMRKKLEDYTAFETEIAKPSFTRPPIRCLGKGGFTLSFFVRMLFSCLVDADYLDTENFMTERTMERGGGDPMEVLLDRLHRHVRKWLEAEQPAGMEPGIKKSGTSKYGRDDSEMESGMQGAVNSRRTVILRACMERGKEAQGLFRLTVPTGGGKTVTSLAFALEHAVEHKLQRIIYVIPYTSIIEQNAQVFRDILGRDNVLEDHSNVVYESELELRTGQLAAENWDKPVVVTTNVQFFESLFASKTSKCRKLHNIAGSVIIFDEAQMLPVGYLKPCIQAVTELVVNYHCTAVMCTATQPELERFFPEALGMKELCPDVREQFEFFRRTVIRRRGKITEEELLAELENQDRVLCILNSRRRVQGIWEALPKEGRFHLSTFMYPMHRKRVLQTIRERLEQKQICRVAATSLVEAGVDLDFGSVFREMAGLDSVIQAAGRCNREGKERAENCETVVFTLEKTQAAGIPPGLKLPIAVGEQVAENFEDITSPEAIREYFQHLYYLRGEGLDVKKIVDQFESQARSRMFPFATVAQQFRLIEEDTRTLLIDIEPEARVIAEKIRNGESSRQLVRDAGMYCVNVYERDFDAMNGAGCLEALPLGFYLLRNREMYTQDMGLCITVDRGAAVFV